MIAILKQLPNMQEDLAIMSLEKFILSHMPEPALLSVVVREVYGQAKEHWIERWVGSGGAQSWWETWVQV